MLILARTDSSGRHQEFCLPSFHQSMEWFCFSIYCDNALGNLEIKLTKCRVPDDWPWAQSVCWLMFLQQCVPAESPAIYQFQFFQVQVQPISQGGFCLSFHSSRMEFLQSDWLYIFLIQGAATCPGTSFLLLRQFPMVLVFGCRLLSFCLPSQRIILVWQRIGLTWVSMILSSIGLVMFPESFVHLDVFSDQSICLKPSVPPSIFKPM